MPLPAERLKKPRIPIPEQDPKKRAKNFNEVALGYSAEMAKEEAARCLLCKKPYCVQGCPVEIDIPAFIQSIIDGDFIKATTIIKQKNSLPAVCGRVCPQEDQCEKLCVLGRKHDSVAIGRLERFAADYAFERGETCITLPEIKHNKRVAVIGSGPAGITCAGDLAMMGYPVTVFESLHQLGGVLVYGIPEFRLPKSIVKDEIACLENLDVNFERNVVVGRTLQVDELINDGYDAVFIGVGAGAPVFMGINGENLNNVFSANEFLTRSNLMKAYLFPKYDTPIAIGNKVAVVGGGNVAMDAARTALRLGAKKVYLVYRRSEEEMPARIEEVHHAKEEGIIFKLLTNPLEVKSDNGWVKGLECIQMELGEPDESGRRRPIPIENSNFTLEVDLVVMAIGTKANPLLTQSVKNLELNRQGYIITDSQTGQTSRKEIFAGGDIVTGSATVILAAGAGKIAARSIDRFLQGKPVNPEPEPESEISLK